VRRALLAGVSAPRRAFNWRFVILALALVAAAAARGAVPAQLPLPCGLPQAQPLWVDYADGPVPFWSTIFARPGVVGAASGLIIPPQLRAKGAKTVFFDLYLSNRVGTPSQPADPSQVQSRADKLFDTAVASSGCDHPLIAENELFGAQNPTPWTATTAQYRANVLAYLQRLAERGARPFLLLSNRPYTHDPVADDWWRSVAQVADIVPEVYFAGPRISKLGPTAGSLRVRSTLRTRIQDLIQIGIPTSRLGFMLTFSSTPKAGGREGLQPLAKWLDVVKWEALAAKAVSAELDVASVWSWGWAAFNPAGNDPDKPKVACAWLWTRDHSLCAPPAELDQSLTVGVTLPAGAICLLGTKTTVLATDVAALTRLTGDREVALSAAFAHAVLAEARPAADATYAENQVIANRFHGNRGAYQAALNGARLTRTLAREILADELRRITVEATLRVTAPAEAETRAWYDTHAADPARLVRLRKRTQLLLATEPTPEGARQIGEQAPLGAFPYDQAKPAVRRALTAQEKEDAFAVWSRRRQNQSLGRLTCRADQLPQPATVDLTGYAPFLALQ
jgi:hypothetical protein